MQGGVRGVFAEVDKVAWGTHSSVSTDAHAKKRKPCEQNVDYISLGRVEYKTRRRGTRPRECVSPAEGTGSTTRAAGTFESEDSLSSESP